MTALHLYDALILCAFLQAGCWGAVILVGSAWILGTPLWLLYGR